jgi:hypothetical protein
MLRLSGRCGIRALDLWVANRFECSIASARSRKQPMKRSVLWWMSALACSACGANFQASGAGGAGNVGMSGGTGSTVGGGESGGNENAGGALAKGGASSGGSSAAGAHSGGASAGGSVSSGGRMGSGIGGAVPSGGSGGNAGAPDCATLQKTFMADVERARTCDLGSTNECSLSSSFPPTCGCPIYVNAKSQYVMVAKQDQKAIADAGCHYAMCLVACQLAASVSCAQSTAMGSPVCAASGSIVSN